MIGVVLLILSIILYVTNLKKWSILLFLSFSCRGFCVLTDNVMELKNQDAALVYFLVIIIYSFFQEKGIQIYKNRALEKCLKFFFIFLCLSILFSIIYYKLDLYQVIQGSRRYFIVFSYFFLRKIALNDICWVVKKVLIISVITGGLYVIQSLTGLAVLPDSDMQLSTDSVENTLRYYNYPPCLEISLFILLFDNKFYRGWKNKLSIAILLTALFASQGRALIAGVVFVFLFGLYLKGQKSKLVQYGIIGLLVAIPFWSVISERFESSDKSSISDIKAITQGEFLNQNNNLAGTMSFRLALVYERMNYLNQRPIGEWIFGMGFLSDQQTKLVNRMYNFQIGLRDRNNGSILQLSTPDIAYGNLICKLGYVGMTIYLLIFGVMLVQAYHFRNISNLIFCLFLLLFSYLYTSFSGATISYAEYLILPLLLMIYMQKIKCNKSK